MTTSPCEHCPVAHAECLGLTVPRLCELAGRREDYRRQLRVLAGELPPPTPEQTAAEIARLKALARECPHWSPAGPCECSGRCALGLGIGGFVALEDCEPCPYRRAV